MTVTIFGILIPAIGILLLWRGSLIGMLMFVMMTTMMGGSATYILDGLGRSSVPPAHTALLFLAVRCLAPGHDRHHSVWPALGVNRWLLLFAGYGMLGAFLLPRIFAGAIDVTPLRPIPGHGLIYTLPLAFSNQNITVSVYLMGTAVAAVTATMAMGRPDAWRYVARTAGVVGFAHAMLGLVSVIDATRPVIAFFRNGYYAQLSHTFGGFDRMTGIFPEAAAFASYGLIWMVFLVELWLRRIEVTWTAPAAVVLALTLVASTSSTAYVGFAAYGALLALRLLVGGSGIGAYGVFTFMMLGLAAFGGALLLMVVAPQDAERFGDIVNLLTIDKLSSGSGVQRAFWARQGIDAFFVSYGLGVGVGSFRSSSLLTAILGSVGVVGALAFLATLLRVHMPWRQSTWVTGTDPRLATGAAASWAAMVSLAPATVAAASPDPGITWGLIAGIALGLRAISLPVAPRKFLSRHEIVTRFRQGQPRPAMPRPATSLPALPRAAGPRPDGRAAAGPFAVPPPRRP